MAYSAQKFITPPGIAKFPALTVPDTKFNALGVYKTGLIVDATAAQPLIDTLTALRDAYLADQIEEATPPIKVKLKAYTVKDVCEVELDDAGEETGNVIFNLKLNAQIQTKTGEMFTQTPKLFDSSNKPVAPEGLKLWGGSKISIAGEVIPYAMASSKTIGVSLRLKAVQIISLSSGGDSSGDAYGFGETEGGFAAPAFPTAQALPDDVVSDDDF